MGNQVEDRGDGCAHVYAADGRLLAIIHYGRIGFGAITREHVALALRLATHGDRQGAVDPRCYDLQEDGLVVLRLDVMLADQPGERQRLGPPREWGGGDSDQPYRYCQPSLAWPYPFSARTYGRLLALRGRVRDGELSELIPAA